MSEYCPTCGHEFKPGDRYIEDKLSEFLHAEPDQVDDIIADLFGSSSGMIKLCESCTETHHGPGWPSLVYEETNV